MGRLFKVIGIVVGALIVLVIAAVVGIALLVDPNDYKDQIAAAVADATGRQLTLEGDLELTVFPSLRIELGPAQLSNAEGFGDVPFAEITRAALAVELWPLLSRRVSITDATFDGLVLNLARDAQGRNNWQDLGGTEQPAAAGEPSSPDGASVDLAVDVIRVTASQVTWNDAATGSQWTLGDFNLQASGFGTDTAFPLSTRFTLTGDGLQVAVGAEMQATLSLATNTYRLEDLAVTLTGEGASWPGGSGEARLSFAALTANLDDETLDLDQLTLQFLGITAHGSLEGRQLMSNLALGGSVEIEPFDPSQLLGEFDVVVETADPAVLRTASAAAMFVYDENRIGLDDMRLALDDSELTGSVGMQGESLRFDLRVDQINVDRYLPPATDEAEPTAEGSIDEVDLPLEALRTLDAQGRLAFGPTQFSGMKLDEAQFTLAARAGQIRLEPTANLYGGRLVGELSLAIEGDAAGATLRSELTDVDLLPLASDLLESELVSGRGDLSLNLTTRGSNVGQMRHDVDGDVAFTFRDGAYEGMDLWYELRRASAVFQREETPEREGERRTPFTTVSATGVVENAILTNRDLNATLEFLTVDGGGTVNLLTNELDFDLVATFLDNEMVRSEPLLADLAGKTLPLAVSGTAAEPSVRPDFAAMVRSRVQEQVTDRLEEERSGVQERVQEEADEVREEVRERLRGIFNR